MVNHSFQRFIQLILLVVSLCCGVAQAEIQVRVDRKDLAVGDTFVVTFSTSGAVSGSPDFTALNQDFQVIGTGQSNNFQAINGKVSQSVSWQVELFAIKAGELEIPSIEFGAEKSPVLKVQVAKEPSPTNATQQDDVLVELVVETDQPYVQQQVIVRQRLLHAVNLSNSQASMSHPEVVSGKGLMRQLGEVQHATEKRNGKEYQVIERRYALFPQSSGEVTVGMTVFEGVIEDARSRRDPFGLMGQHTRRVSKPVTLQVRPQPSSVKGEWLPARSLTLNAFWQPNTDQLKAGDTVNLTLAIVAEGLMAEQLPAVQIQVPAGLKAYSNQPEFRNDGTAGSVIGIREEKWVVVGTANGEIVWPEVKLQWWNTETKQVETATLPAKTFKVSGAGAAVNPAPTPPATAPTQPNKEASAETQTDATAQSASSEQEQPVAESEAKETQWSQRLVAIGVALVGLLVIGYGIYHWRTLHQPAHPSQSKRRLASATTKPDSAWQALQKACQTQQAPAAFAALNRWLREESGLTPPTLAQLKQQASPALQQALDGLNAALYAPQQTQPWQGSDLCKALSAFVQPKPRVVAENGLAVMYPGDFVS